MYICSSFSTGLTGSRGDLPPNRGAEVTLSPHKKLVFNTTTFPSVSILGIYVPIAENLVSPALFLTQSALEAINKIKVSAFWRGPGEPSSGGGVGTTWSPQITANKTNAAVEHPDQRMRHPLAVRLPPYACGLRSRHSVGTTPKIDFDQPCR